MVGAIHQLDLDVHHRVAAEDSRRRGVADAGLHRAHELPGDDPPRDLLDEDDAVGHGEVLGLGLGLRDAADVDDHVAVLAAPARLLDELPMDVVGHAGDRLPVAHSGRADPDPDLAVPHELVLDDLQVQLAHSLDDRLAGLLVVGEPKRGILAVDDRERLAELLLVVVREGLDRQGDHRLREGHALEDDPVLRIAERVAGEGVLEPGHRDDLARFEPVEWLTGLGVHLVDAGEDLLLVVAGVEHPATLVEPPGVDADVREVAVGVRDDLEHERGEGSVSAVGPGEPLLGPAGVDALDLGHLRRVGQVLDHAVEQALDADVPQGRPAEDRAAPQLDRAPAKRPLDLLRGERVLVDDVLLGEAVVEVGRLLDEPVPPPLGRLPQVRGDLPLLDPGAELAGVEVVRLHLDQIDDAFEGVAEADRQLDGDRVGPEPVADRVEAEVEVRADLVHLVDEADARHAIPVGLPPDGFGLGLDAFLGIEHRHHAVEHAKRSLHLDGEVDVAGGVDQVDLVGPPAKLPWAARGCGLDRDAPLLLLLEEVHGGGALVHLADLVAAAGVVEDALRHRGLARVDVGTDADVADGGEIGGHGRSLLPEPAGAGRGRMASRGRSPASPIEARLVIDRFACPVHARPWGGGLRSRRLGPSCAGPVGT